ncbi:hypothetical protein HN51_068154, partial [Arachis hypogaea]
ALSHDCSDSIQDDSCKRLSYERINRHYGTRVPHTKKSHGNEVEGSGGIGGVKLLGTPGQ